MKTLILLVGPQGSGKTTYCEENLRGYTRISQDEQGKEGHFKAYHEAMGRGDELVVVDRINHRRDQRGRYAHPAREAGYHVKIVWLNVDRATCLKRISQRKGHRTLKAEDAEKALYLFFREFQAPSRRESNEVVVIGNAPFFVDVKDLTGEIGARRHVIVGDVHGCLDELQDLLSELGFDPQEDVLISVGDLVDRGPKVKETTDFVQSLPRFFSVKGNHDDKCIRYYQGNKVKMTHGLTRTIESFGAKMPAETLEFLRKLPYVIKTPSGYVVHAGFDPLMSAEEQGRADCLYMRYYGGSSYFDSLGGVLWYKLWPKDAPRVFFGHIPDPSAPQLPNVVSLDGGCVFGDYLKAWDSRDGIVHYAKARQKYCESEHAAALALSPHEQVQKREEYVVAGLLRKDASDDGKLAIYTYTDQCTYDKLWDEITVNSRGHIFNVETGECVARPMRKFWNLGENPSVAFEALPWDEPYEIFEKMDGWMSSLFRHNGRFRIASRGSFHSQGATWATEFIQKIDWSFLPDEATIVFEMISPALKIILDYGDMSTLVVLCGFDRHAGDEYPRCVMEEWAAKAGLPIVKKYEGLTIHDCLRLQKELKDKEGFVIRFKDGTRVKVKGDWYVKIAKILANLTPISIWDAMRAGRVQREYLAQIPEEFRSLADGYVMTLEGQYSKAMEEVMGKARSLAAMFPGDKKSLALYMNARRAEVGDLAYKAAFMVADGKMDKMEKLVMDRIYPKNNEMRSI